ncbi:CALCIUM-DEPENDENT PROTEIN KINASE 32-LIKE [Salix koriyanagi]|uniref:CALCIUM-DEPENDENT PROTEIN KINASE 32-LIKE n=1 Tax=Salix koriyanagi TaxID=2511006 RepID=A0A9Q0VH61_9ROSI|nr:CALCIUM-DEPENDENT PROTEIN KINASE 32-LIKE [Salix koriyanagi]
MGNCCVTPPGDRDKKKHKKKHNRYALDYGLHDGGHKLTVLKNPAGKEIEQRYELGRELGRGEFGITYLCTDKETETEQGVAQAIIRSVIDFKRDPWPRVSDNAKDLVRKMLDPDPKCRPTAATSARSPLVAKCEEGS